MADLKVLKKLGEETKRKFSQVYLLENQKTGQLFVLKKAGKSTREQLACQSLINEAQFSFECDGLPQVVDFQDGENECVLLLKYQEGENLSSYWQKLHKNERLPFISLLLEKLNSIFEVLQEKKIVHADLKPNNILIQGSRLDFSVRLIDFGLAFYTNQIPSRKVVFSLAYAAPELILNRLNLCDSRSDFYSLGIVLYQLYSGEFPISHANPAIMTNLQVSYPVENKHHLPKVLFSIIKQLCEKEGLPKPVQYFHETQLEEILIKGKEKRPMSLLFPELGILKEKKETILEKLVKIFSKT